MIPDHQTNTLYLADCLPIKQPAFFQRFEGILRQLGIPFSFLPGTRDIWAVDYMPVQVNEHTFIRFTYEPEYLQYKKYRHTISDVDSICTKINLQTIKSDLILDGGNISRTADTVVMCDKIFLENKELSRNELIGQLTELFQIDRLYFVPWDKNDFTGHIDGMLRFIDNDTVLINDYSIEDPAFGKRIKSALSLAKLNWVELPYAPPDDPSLVSARGNYLNYLQMEQALVVPVFNIKEDETALKILEEVFPSQRIATVESNEVADEGGILNCITWNIMG